MAERIRLSIPAGERATHRLAWVEEGKEADRAGSLQWSVHVLDEQEVELGVTVEWGPGPDADIETVADEQDEQNILPPLQEVGRNLKFQGSFEPKTALLGQPRGVQAIVFNVSNVFSWFTAKEVEIVTLLDRPQGPPLSAVPPLPPLAPLPAPPRSDGNGNATAEGGSETALASVQTPELRTPAAAGAGGEADAVAAEILRFGDHLDALLGAAEERCPTLASCEGEAGPWLEEVLAHMATLRGICKRRPVPGKVVEAKEEAARPAEPDEPDTCQPTPLVEDDLAEEAEQQNGNNSGAESPA